MIYDPCSMAHTVRVGHTVRVILMSHFSNLQKVNRDNKNNATMGKQNEYRDRRHTAPAGERPIRKPTSTLNKADNITTGPAIYPTDTDPNS